MKIGTFDTAEVRSLYQRAVRERDLAVAEYERLGRTITHLNQVIEGLSGLAPDVTGAPRVVNDEDSSVTRNNTTPTTIEAAVAAVAERKGDWMAVKSVTDVLRNRGTLPQGDTPESAVRAALRRAAAQRLVEKGQLDGRTTAYRWLATIHADAEDPRARGSSDSGQVSEPWPLERGGTDESGTAPRDHDANPRVAGTKHPDHDHGASVGSSYGGP